MAKAKKLVGKKLFGNNFKPVAGYVLIEPLKVEEKTAGGIYLPETAKEKPQVGKVLAVGPAEIVDSETRRECPAAVGQNVIYKKWGGNEVKEGTEEVLFVKFEDILAVEEK